MLNSLRSELRQLGNTELRKLSGVLLRNRSEVENQLELQFKRRLFYLSKDDEKRLLTLRVWSEKYHVSVGYILSVLVPFYAQRFRKTRKKQQRGLPCGVATLCGKAAEYWLRQQLAKDFQDQENVELWKQEKRKEILLQRDARENGVDEFEPRRKTILDYEWPSYYVRAYKKRIRAERKLNQQQLNSEENKRRNYRGNPFL